MVDRTPVELAQRLAAEAHPPQVGRRRRRRRGLDPALQHEPHLVGPVRVELDGDRIAVQVAGARRVRTLGLVAIQQRLDAHRAAERAEIPGDGG
ncbi:MAG: hypothetical protein ACYTJ0_13155, partial [Planctomycetota bacterium]